MGSSSSRGGDFIEDVVCKESDLEENNMKVFSLGSEDHKVLLIKQKGIIYATGTKCSHYGAPLEKGYLGKDRLRCPWHGACFNIQSGDIEDFPGLDSLPCYEVKVDNGDVTVRARRELLEGNKRVRAFTRVVRPKTTTFLVVGGGPAGAACVENLRAQGFDGRIVFILAENYLPYDRVKLSKALDIEAEKLILRPMSFYRERNIEVKLKTKLTQLNPSKNVAILDNGETLKFDKIFLATGSTPRRPEVPGSDLKNIFVLRTIDDARQIRDALSKNSHVVIVGTSFIGMEAAAFCAGKVASLVVVGKSVPFRAAFGTAIGTRMLQLFQEKNIRFELGGTVEAFEGKGGKLKAVHVTGDLRIPADLCVIGIGAASNTSYLKSSGIPVRQDGTIEVNEFLQTNFPNVFAGGDIAYAPILGQKATVAHWGLATYHGYNAAFNMLNQKKLLKTVPFFWTTVFGKGLRHSGLVRDVDDIVIHGSVDELAFIAFHCSQDVVVAVTTLNRDPLAAKFAELLYEGKELKKREINRWLKG